jgi:hypothetical protein
MCGSMLGAFEELEGEFLAHMPWTAKNPVLDPNPGLCKSWP